MIFDLIGFELNVMTLDGLHWNVDGVRDNLLVQCGRVDDHVETRSHFRVDYNAEGLDFRMDVVAELSAADHNDVLAHDQPVHMLKGEVGRDVEDHEAAHADLFGVRCHLEWEKKTCSCFILLT